MIEVMKVDGRFCWSERAGDDAAAEGKLSARAVTSVEDGGKGAFAAGSKVVKPLFVNGARAGGREVVAPESVKGASAGGREVTSGGGIEVVEAMKSEVRSFIVVSWTAVV